MSYMGWYRLTVTSKALVQQTSVDTNRTIIVNTSFVIDTSTFSIFPISKSFDTVTYPATKYTTSFDTVRTPTIGINKLIDTNTSTYVDYSFYADTRSMFGYSSSLDTSFTNHNIWENNDTLWQVKNKLNYAMDNLISSVEVKHNQLVANILDIYEYGLTKSKKELNLDKVDNTSDIEKPLSVPQQEYIDKKFVQLKAHILTKLHNDLLYITRDVNDEGDFEEIQPYNIFPKEVYTYVDEDKTHARITYYNQVEVVYNGEPVVKSVILPTNDYNTNYRIQILQELGEVQPNFKIVDNQTFGERQVLIPDNKRLYTTMYEVLPNEGLGKELNLVVLPNDNEYGVYKVMIIAFANEEEPIPPIGD